LWKVYLWCMYESSRETTTTTTKTMASGNDILWPHSSDMPSALVLIILPLLGSVPFVPSRPVLPTEAGTLAHTTHTQGRAEKQLATQRRARLHGHTRPAELERRTRDAGLGPQGSIRLIHPRPARPGLVTFRLQASHGDSQCLQHPARSVSLLRIPSSDSWQLPMRSLVPRHVRTESLFSEERPIHPVEQQHHHHRRHSDSHQTTAKKYRSQAVCGSHLD
jgi:hypothetical protein